MSVASIGASTAALAATAVPSGAHQRRADFRALGKALESGDLAGAQSAFADLTKLLQSGGGASASDPATAASAGGAVTASSNATSPLQSDFEALAQALQSGDVKSAKSAFAQLMKDMKGVRGQHGGTQQAAAPTGGTDADGDNDGSQASSAPAQRGSLNLVA